MGKSQAREEESCALGRRRASGQGLTVAGAGAGAVPGVDGSGWSSFRARGTTAHGETVLRL